MVDWGPICKWEAVGVKGFDFLNKLFLIALAASVSPNVANAAEDKFSATALKLPDQAYVSGWFIEPGVITVPTEPLRGGESILKTAFFPYKTYALEADHVFKEPGDRVTSGTELIGYIAHYPTACTAKAVSRTAGQALLLRGGTRHLCLVDSNNDGAFDKRFFVDSKFSLLAHQALIPKDAEVITPVRYHETDRLKSPVTGYFSLFYYAHHSLVKEFSIGFAFVRGGESTSGADGVTAYSFKDKEIPVATKFFGGAYRIEKMEKGRITVRSEGPQSLTPIYLGTKCCIN
jgi:hypothetical protein